MIAKIFVLRGRSQVQKGSGTSLTECDLRKYSVQSSRYYALLTLCRLAE